MINIYFYYEVFVFDIIPIFFKRLVIDAIPFPLQFVTKDINARKQIIPMTNSVNFIGGYIF